MVENTKHGWHWSIKVIAVCMFLFTGYLLSSWMDRTITEESTNYNESHWNYTETWRESYGNQTIFDTDVSILAHPFRIYLEPDTELQVGNYTITFERLIELLQLVETLESGSQ